VKVHTTRFGEVEVSDDKLITMPLGLLGFGRYKDYIVLDHGEDSPFKWLQSCEDPDLAFVIADPLFFKADYHIEVKKAEIEIIEPKSMDDLLVCVIMTIPSDPTMMTANLCAPLIFNINKRLGMQIVLQKSGYPIKWHVMSEWKNEGAAVQQEQESVSTYPISVTPDFT